MKNPLPVEAKRPGLVRNRGCVLACALAVALPMAASQAAILNDWTFGETSGTLLSAIDATGTDPAATSFGGTSTGVATTGGGVLRAENTTGSDYFSNATISEIASGHTYLRAEIAGWDFSNTTSGSESGSVGFGFRDNGAGSQDLALVRLRHNNDNETRLEVRVDGANTQITDFAFETSSTGLDIVIDLDIDAGTFDVLYREGSDPYILGLDNFAVGVGTTAPDRIRFVSATGVGDSGDFVDLDRLVHVSSEYEALQIPEPGSVAMLGVGVLIMSALRRRPRHASL